MRHGRIAHGDFYISDKQCTPYPDTVILRAQVPVVILVALPQFRADMLDFYQRHHIAMRELPISPE